MDETVSSRHKHIGIRSRNRRYTCQWSRHFTPMSIIDGYHNTPNLIEYMYFMNQNVYPNDVPFTIHTSVKHCVSHTSYLSLTYLIQIIHIVSCYEKE